jgi:hypothetical protein
MRTQPQRCGRAVNGGVRAPGRGWCETMAAGRHPITNASRHPPRSGELSRRKNGSVLDWQVASIIESLGCTLPPFSANHAEVGISCRIPSQKARCPRRPRNREKGGDCVGRRRLGAVRRKAIPFKDKPLLHGGRTHENQHRADRERPNAHNAVDEWSR